MEKEKHLEMKKRKDGEEKSKEENEAEEEDEFFPHITAHEPHNFVRL